MALAPASVAGVAATSPPLSESFKDFMRIEAKWDAKGAKQATVAMNKSVSLMGDRPVNEIRQTSVEEFRLRMKDMPNLFGKSIYIGMPALDALTAAERLRADIAATPGSGPISWNEAQKQGRDRRPFTREKLTAIFEAPLFKEPFQFELDRTGTAQLQQARFWSIMISLHSGIRLIPEPV